MSTRTTLSQAPPMTAAWTVPMQPVVPTPVVSPADIPGQKEAVHFAKALIYKSRTGEAIRVLKGISSAMECRPRSQGAARRIDARIPEDRRRNWVQGQVHNHLGYAYWMNQGHYRLALREFRAALPYFAASDWHEEYANTCDNIGRVYALLRQHKLAQHWIDKGLRMRRELKNEYRTALSLNSQAIAYQISGDLYRAHQPSMEALGIFEKLGAQRGIGLAGLTRARLLRRWASFDTIYSYGQCTALLDQAAKVLARSVRIFGQQVFEPVRLIETHNQQGRTYRDWADLARRRDPTSLRVRLNHAPAVRHLKTAIKLAEKENRLLAVDSYVDLARTYLQNRQFDVAERWLRRAEDAVPDAYKLRQGSGLRDIPIEECVEGFWYQMSKIERLRADLASAGRVGHVNGKAFGGTSKQAARQHHARAVAYLKHYSELDLEPWKPAA